MPVPLIAIVVAGLFQVGNVVRAIALARGLWHAISVTRAAGGAIQLLRFSATNARMLHIVHEGIEYTVKFVKATGAMTVARVGGGELSPKLLPLLRELAPRAQGFSGLYETVAKEAARVGPKAFEFLWKAGG